MTRPADNQNFKNRTLFHGDNLDFLRGINSGTVHLIATDPPFNKSKDFHATPTALPPVRGSATGGHGRPMCIKTGSMRYRMIGQQSGKSSKLLESPPGRIWRRFCVGSACV